MYLKQDMEINLDRDLELPGLGEDVGPERAIAGERAVRDVCDSGLRIACAGLVDRLADDDLIVAQRRQVHRLGDGLARGQAEPPAPLEIAQRQRSRTQLDLQMFLKIFNEQKYRKRNTTHEQIPTPPHSKAVPGAQGKH